MISGGGKQIALFESCGGGSRGLVHGSAVIEILEGNFCTSEDARAPRHKLHRELFAYFPRERGPEKRERERERERERGNFPRRGIFPGRGSCPKRSDEGRIQVLHTHPPRRGDLFPAKSIIQISSGVPRARISKGYRQKFRFASAATVETAKGGVNFHLLITSRCVQTCRVLDSIIQGGSFKGGPPRMI